MFSPEIDKKKMLERKIKNPFEINQQQKKSDTKVKWYFM